MTSDFRRVAIVNRGEPAMRFVHAARELNDERGLGLRTIALYTNPDRRAMFVREADESVCLGPALQPDPATGRRTIAYLDLGCLERALLQAGAEAVWAGWGFVSEQASFVEMLDRLGIVFIGPPASAMRLLSDKIAAKRLAESAGVDVVPWSGGLLQSADEALEHAARIGYPVMLKASAGGGGRGIRRVDSAEAMAEAFARAQSEARGAFGDPSLFLEKAFQGVRHVEVQVIGDLHGTLWAVGVRDCTVQRRHQKVLEEAPAPGLAALEPALRDSALRIARAAGYHSTGTVEYLYDTAAGRFHFMEVNARLQVEHTVTEVTTGLDLVKLQVQVARGERLEGAPPPTVGHAVEVRLNAEDPENGFAPAPGTFVLFRLPTGPGLRIDCGVAEGDSVAPEFDSMVAKLVAHGRDRDEALARLRRALSECTVAVEDGTTNRAFLLELLDRPELRRVEIDTTWLERALSEPRSKPHGHVALLQAAIEAYEASQSVEQAGFYAAAARLRPETRADVGGVFEFREDGNGYRVRVLRLDRDEFRCESDGRALHVRVDRLGPFERWLTTGGRRYRVLSMVQGAEVLVEVDGVPRRFSRDDLGIVRAASPAVVVRVRVRPGDHVLQGDPLVVLEAMKMEMTVAAPFSGRVRAVLVEANAQVPPGAPLVQLDAPDRVDGSGVERIQLPPEPPASGGDGLQRTLADARRLVLGFDIDDAHARRLLADYQRLAAATPPSDDEFRLEDEILRIFADTASLFRRQTAPAASERFEHLSAGEYFLSYLRNVDADAPGLPAVFLEQLQRAVSHYGVPTLVREPLLLESLHRLWKARQRAELQVPLLLAILERRVGLARRHDGAAAGFAPTLDALIAAVQGRHPSLADVARDVRYRMFEHPAYESTRSRAFAEAEAQLDVLAAHPEAPDRERRIAALVACPQPLFGTLAARFDAASREVRQLMLEVMTRRYYRIRRLERVRTWAVDDWVGAATEYEHEGRRVHLLTTYCRYERLQEMGRHLAPVLEQAPAGHEIALDLYAWRPGPLGDAAETAACARAALNAAAVDGRPAPQRVVLAVAGPESGWALDTVHHFTFERTASGYEEQRIYRGFHPLIGERLRLSRLANFEIERLPSPEDVFLFHGRARTNPKDERLFALAEVRDATPVRDASGRVVHIPHLERMFLESAAAMRAFQARRRPTERLHWNQIFLDVWPPLDATIEEVGEIARRDAPYTEGLGLEKVMMCADVRRPGRGGYRNVVLSVSNPGANGLVMAVEPNTSEPVRPLSEYGQKVTRMRQRGLTYPYEIIRMLTPAGDAARSDVPPGCFREYDLDEQNRLQPVQRPYGSNQANVVVGVVSNRTERYPEGITRVIVLGDPSREMGSIAEPECRRIVAALDLAESMGVPAEWFAVSAGARISMESGTENMDWISRVLRRLVLFTQAGCEINVVVCGINVGAQPYWNAEATMLMHTKGILVMVPEGAMVLTGKTALDYSGSVSAEDNSGIGGYERVMGPNGEAQYWARDLFDACRVLLAHYEHSYVAPGERFPRRARTDDPCDRDVCLSPHGGDGLATLGDVFGEEKNPGRKRPFEVRNVMAAVVDADHPPLERWAGMCDAEIAVVWDAHLGGQPVCLIGLQSRPLPRLGFVPTDGPQEWTAGTLFPKSSKKVARAINAASGSRPLVILANLTGFDGSPESMRRAQLEYGAEIGRAVVNFRGPIVFCVISRYHGGAFVVFSKALNDNMEAAALEGTYASVIGGAPAAAVVFAREVDARTRREPRVVAVETQLAAAQDGDKRRLRATLDEVMRAVRSEKLGEIADEFDAIHSVERARRVGSLDRIIPPSSLRPYLIDAVQRGMRAALAGTEGGSDERLNLALAPAGAFGF